MKTNHTLFFKHVGKKEFQLNKRLMITTELSMTRRRILQVVIRGMDGEKELET